MLAVIAFQNENTYVAPSYANRIDRDQFKCPSNIFSTGLGLFSRVGIAKGVDIGLYGGLIRTTVDWQDHIPKTHARRSSNSIDVYDGFPVREWLVSSLACPEVHRHRGKEDCEYIISNKAPVGYVSCWNKMGKGFMMNTSFDSKAINVSLIPIITNKLRPHWLMRTKTEIVAGDELLCSYQSTKVIFIWLFLLLTFILIHRKINIIVEQLPRLCL